MGGSISERKLAANRANAQLSTGPRTPEGKRKSSRNAMKHGLLSEQILLDHDEADEFDALKESLYADLQPVGALEEVLVDRIIVSVWFQRRALQAEAALMEWHNGLQVPSHSRYCDETSKWRSEQPEHDPAFGALTDHRLAKIERYETTRERQMFRALHELQRLQSARQNAVALAPVGVDVDVRGNGPSAK